MRSLVAGDPLWQTYGTGCELLHVAPGRNLILSDVAIPLSVRRAAPREYESILDMYVFSKPGNRDFFKGVSPLMGTSSGNCREGRDAVRAPHGPPLLLRIVGYRASRCKWDLFCCFAASINTRKSLLGRRFRRRMVLVRNELDWVSS